MRFEIFPSGPVQTNTLLVVCESTGEAAIVDPAFGVAKKILETVESASLQCNKILLTHSHWDHIADLKIMAEAYSASIYVHPEDAGNVIEPGSDGLSSPIDIPGLMPTHYVREGDLIPIGTSQWRVIETPGHTPGGICYYCESEGVLLSGDTLFHRSYGRLDLPTATPSAMIGSLKKLASLPPSTLVYPGHGPTTTLDQEAWIKNPRKALKF